MNRWNGSAIVALTTVKRWNGSAMVDLTVAKRWNGSAFVDLTLPGGGGVTLNVTVSPGNAVGFVSNNAQYVNVTSNSVTANVTGGTGPHTYLWEKVSGDSAVLPNSPTSATTSFTATVPKFATREAIYKVTVTDSLGAVDTAQISVSLSHEGTS